MELRLDIRGKNKCNQIFIIRSKEEKIEFLAIDESKMISENDVVSLVFSEAEFISFTHLIGSIRELSSGCNDDIILAIEDKIGENNIKIEQHITVQHNNTKSLSMSDSDGITRNITIPKEIFNSLPKEIDVKTFIYINTSVLGKPPTRHIQLNNYSNFISLCSLVSNYMLQRNSISVYERGPASIENIEEFLKG